MPNPLVAVAGGSLLMGVMQANSAKKQANAQAQAAQAATDSQFAMHQDTMARNDAFVNDAKGEYQQQLGEIENLYSSTQAELQRAYQAQDQMAIQRLEGQLSELEQNHQSISADMDKYQAQLGGQINQYGQQAGAMLDQYETQDAARLADGRTDTADTRMRIGNNTDIAQQELNRVQAMGSKPEGLDAGLSEIDSGYRDAEMKVARENAGQVSDGAKLAMAFNKSRDKAGLNANMRKDWANNRSSTIGNLSSTVNNSILAGHGLGESQRANEQQSSRFNIGNRTGLLEKVADTNINNTSTWLGRKLDAKEKLNAARVGYKDDTSALRMDRAKELSGATISNNANKLSLRNVALGNLNATRTSAMGNAVAANNNMAGIYGDIAQTNITAAGQSAARAQQAIGNSINTGLKIAGNDRIMDGMGNLFKKSTPGVPGTDPSDYYRK